MCGRFSLRDVHNHPINQFPGALLSQEGPRYNITPGQSIVIGVAYDRAGTRDIMLDQVRATFGFLPEWATPDRKRQKNARGETVAEKPYFRSAVAATRCLIPADGWNEWKGKHKYFIHRRDEAGFFFAGLYSRHARPDGTTQYSFCIITVDATPDLAGIHDRMPVVVHDDDWMDWLHPKTPLDKVKAIIRAPEAGTFVFERVKDHGAAEGPQNLDPPDPELF